MFNKNDPLVGAVANIMKENEARRQVEKKLCEELGIYSRQALPREHQANYDALLEQRLDEAKKEDKKSDAKLSPRDEQDKKVENSLAAYRDRIYQRRKENLRKEELVGNQHKIDANKNNRVDPEDFKILRSGKKAMSEAELAGPETGARKTSGSNQPIAEEQLDELKGIKEPGKKDEYVKKAKSSVGRKILKAGLKKMVGLGGPSDDDMDTIQKRVTGIARAGDRRTAADLAGMTGTNMPRSKKRKMNEEDKSSSHPDFAAPRAAGAPTYKDEIKYKPEEPKAEMPKNPPMPPRRPSNLEEEELSEKKLTDAEMSKREELAKKMKKGDWSKRYGERGKSVMYATATKMAKELAEDITLDSVMEELRKNLGEEKFNKIFEEIPTRQSGREGEAQIGQRVSNFVGGIKSAISKRLAGTNPQAPSAAQSFASGSMNPPAAAKPNLDSPSERTNQVARTATPPAPKPAATSAPRPTPSSDSGERDPGTGELRSGAQDLNRLRNNAERDPGTGELRSTAKDLSTLAKSSSPANRPAATPAAASAPTPRPAATPAAAPAPASRQMFQAAQDRADRGENDTAAFFRADQQMQRERGMMRESVESTIRKIIQK